SRPVAPARAPRPGPFPEGGRDGRGRNSSRRRRIGAHGEAEGAPAMARPAPPVAPDPADPEKPPERVLRGPRQGRRAAAATGAFAPAARLEGAARLQSPLQRGEVRLDPGRPGGGR